MTEKTEIKKEITSGNNVDNKSTGVYKEDTNVYGEKMESMMNTLIGKIDNIKVNRNIEPPFYINHMYRFDWFGHNWQNQDGDKISFFMKYGYIWFYSGFPQRGDRYNLMKQTWEAIEGNYK